MKARVAFIFRSTFSEPCERSAQAAAAFVVWQPKN
jgi:hypothetical protein